MTDISHNITMSNVENIRRQIAKKQGSEPYWSVEDNALNALTDYDVFPYTKWFRGNYKSTEPIVAEREAGYRKRQDNCYKITNPETPANINYPNHCFEVPCSTVFPCYPKYAQRMLDRDAMNVAINKSCVTQYR